MTGDSLSAAALQGAARPDLPVDYTLDDVAAALGMSTRWVRDQIKGGAEHMRYGHKIRFTAEQVERLRAAHIKAPATQPVTSGKRKSR